MLMPPKQQIDLDIKQQQDELEAREKKEDINLLYVALTRARQYLFVSGSGGKEGGWYEALQHDIAPVLEVELEPLVQQTAVASVALFRTIEEEPILDFPDDLSEVSPSTLGQSSQNKSYASVHKDGTLRGTVIHRILYLLAIQQGQVVQQIHDEFPQLDEDQRNAYFAEANALLCNKTLNSLFDDTLYKKVFNEMPLSFIWQDKQYYGIIDRLCLSNDAVWIVDYKTHRDIDSSTIPKLAETYFDQMYAYTHGVSLLFPKHQLRTSLVSTTAGTCFDYNFSDSDSSAKR
ncbi:MAG: PD-(D/E)XK nuclease family protein, partial [Candidatus Oxydemutatoraceae bacterium WSBS_2016_MAG_OTU14]